VRKGVRVIFILGKEYEGVASAVVPMDIGTMARQEEYHGMAGTEGVEDSRNQGFE